MKKYIFIALQLTSSKCLLACEACKKQQSNPFTEITHGRGPENSWDYLVVAIMVLITLYVLFASLKYLLRPAERNRAHIKNIIFQQ